MITINEYVNLIFKGSFKHTCMGYARRFDGCTMTLIPCFTKRFTLAGLKGARLSQTV